MSSRTTSGNNRSPNSSGSIATPARGLEVLNSPSLNKGTAFSEEERRSLGLTGLLPPEISTLETQVRRAYVQYERLPDALSKNVYLTALHDRNQVLFYRLFSEHLREMIPIVNDLTVGLAMEQYHHEFRRPRGLYLSIDHPGSIDEAFNNLRAAPGEIDLILATDAEQILGIGDWGVGGIEVSIGKLAIYTAAGGITPSRAIPVMLDVGTNRESLLNDPMYIGNRHPRIRGEKYDAFIEAYIRTATTRFPQAILQFEDFVPENGRRILRKYSDGLCLFNDDIQGTGAITMAALISALRVNRTRLIHQRVVIFGCGTAGIGVADEIRAAMIRDGMPPDEALRRFWCVDKGGLLTSDQAAVLRDFQLPYARPAAESKNWARDGNGIGLAEVVHRVRPTVLIGASAAAGAFTESIIREVAASSDRPTILMLSSPFARAEANATDLMAWTGGRALVATGSASPPVTYRGITYVVGQINNALIYPGLILGAIIARASRLSDGMRAAAANAVSSLVAVAQPGASLLPHVDDLRAVSRTVAVAVAEAADAEGLARVQLGDIDQQVLDAMWQPAYRRIEAC